MQYERANTASNGIDTAIRRKQKVVSVIVPVYNSIHYLQRCVGSILQQEYSKLEVLLVDDGSDDGSAELCDNLAREDSRIRVIHQANGGEASARNTGLDHASGDLIMWVDSDDWIDPTWVKKFVEELEGNDVDLVMAAWLDDVLVHPVPLMQYCMNHIEHTMWISCAKRSLYNGLRFEKFTIGVDAVFLVRLVWAAQRVRVLPRPLGYHYVENDSSVSRIQSLKNKVDWPGRARAEYDFVSDVCPKYIRCAQFDIMRGAGVIYRSLHYMNVPIDEEHQRIALMKELRSIVMSGLSHLPWSYMRLRDLKQIVITIRDLIC